MKPRTCRSGVHRSFALGSQSPFSSAVLLTFWAILWLLEVRARLQNLALELPLHIFRNETPWERKSWGWASLSRAYETSAKVSCSTSNETQLFLSICPPAYEEVQLFSKTPVFLCCANWVSWGLSFAGHVSCAVQRKSWSDQVSMRAFVPIRSGLD